MPAVVKAQVLTGGRGKAGGAVLANTPDEAQHAEAILGMDIKGHKVLKVLVDPASEIQSEIYLGVMNDRAARKPVIVASLRAAASRKRTDGAEKIIREHTDPFLACAITRSNLAYGIERRASQEAVHADRAGAVPGCGQRRKSWPRSTR